MRRIFLAASLAQLALVALPEATPAYGGGWLRGHSILVQNDLKIPIHIFVNWTKLEQTVRAGGYTQRGTPDQEATIKVCVLQNEYCFDLKFYNPAIGDPYVVFQGRPIILSEGGKKDYDHADFPTGREGLYSEDFAIERTNDTSGFKQWTVSVTGLGAFGSCGETLNNFGFQEPRPGNRLVPECNIPYYTPCLGKCSVYVGFTCSPEYDPRGLLRQCNRGEWPQTNP
jgi:hypothetical protein